MTVVDEFTRQGFELTVGRYLTAGDVIDVLEKLFLEHGRPACLRSDNGLEKVRRNIVRFVLYSRASTDNYLN
jgi:putative transposase